MENRTTGQEFAPSFLGVHLDTLPNIGFAQLTPQSVKARLVAGLATSLPNQIAQHRTRLRPIRVNPPSTLRLSRSVELVTQFR